MVLRPIEEAEFIKEIEKWVAEKIIGDGSLIAAADHIQEQLKKRGLQFSPEEFCSAINVFLHQGRAKLAELCVSEYQPDTLSVDIEFRFNKEGT